MSEKYQQLFSLLFNNSSEAIIILDIKGNLKQANPIADRILAVGSEGLTRGKPWKFTNLRTLDGKAATEIVEKHIQKALRQENAKFPLNLINDDGEICNTDILISCIEIDNEQSVVVQIKDISEPHRNQKLLKVNRLILEEIAQGVSLPVILDAICREVELMVTDSICTVMSVDKERQTMMLAAGPSVSDELAQLFKNLPIKKGYGSCGTAAFSGVEEFVGNTFSDPRWEYIRESAIQFGIKSCWSMPVLGISEEPIGTIALSQLKVGMPGKYQIDMLENMSSLVGLAIQNDHHRMKMLEFGQQFRSIVNALPDLVFILSKEGKYLQIHGSDKMQKLLFKKSELLLGNNIKDVLTDDTAVIVQQLIDKTLVTNESQQIEYKLNVPLGVIWFEGRTAPIEMPDSETSVIWIARDITSKKQIEEEVKHMAYHDALTGLPNRKLCLDNMSKAISYAKRHKVFGAVMNIDIDNFKSINDDFGHHVGDLVLREFANRLNHCFRSEDTVARFGGDEFLILLSLASVTKGEVRSEIKTIASKIKDEVSAYLSINNADFNLQCSIGVAIFPEQSDDMDELIKMSDLAMYQSKSKGKNTASIFEKQK